ncbi:hypothetical protein WG68_08650 [Arsukibacterium ikkense]|uniref:Uncharacterized protein n=1 Tax=Arsukibacterium ikkense TaxID=336831 RepID=A0A0M2V7Z7_9GAMM|nr:hypothetical protein [Arsukibacterium ikkense]KKO45775.1 hypothetical protein WG68_08650 [Arsukibacterium ikkense]
MTIGQYLLLAAVGYAATGYLCYRFIFKPAKRKIYERYSPEESEILEPDTEFAPGRLYRVEGRQVMIVPTECELSVSRVKIRRVSEALVIYPRDRAWSEYADLLPADSYTLHKRQDANNEEKK